MDAQEVDRERFAIEANCYIEKASQAMSAGMYYTQQSEQSILMNALIAAILDSSHGVQYKLDILADKLHSIVVMGQRPE